VYDELTGLPNRRLFESRLNEERKRAERHHEPFACVLIGIATGPTLRDSATPIERLLIRGAAAVKRSVREGDVVARFGTSTIATLLAHTHFIGTIAATDRILDFGTLEFIHRHKTGALFMASASVGAAAARASAAERDALVAYAKNLGLAFQIVDDLIDATGDAGVAGKDVGKDVKKTTFVSFAGTAGAWQLAGELIDTSEAALRGFGPRAQPLRDLARYVVSRRR
jgi:diguanylate cyclase (GGDEF)-like protein